MNTSCLIDATNAQIQSLNDDFAALNADLTPNPFSSFTSFEFVSKESGNSTVALFDLTGAKIALLFNDYTETGTTYKVGFTANNLAAGIYFARFITPTGEIVHQKLMLTTK